MPRTLTAFDRSALIRLASTLPKGSPERKAILAGLGKSKSERSMQYLRVQALKADLEKIRTPVLELAEYTGTGLPPGVERALQQFVSHLLFLNTAISRGR